MSFVFVCVIIALFFILPTLKNDKSNSQSNKLIYSNISTIISQLQDVYNLDRNQYQSNEEYENDIVNIVVDILQHSAEELNINLEVIEYRELRANIITLLKSKEIL